MLRGLGPRLVKGLQRCERLCNAHAQADAEVWLSISENSPCSAQPLSKCITAFMSVPVRSVQRWYRYKFFYGMRVSSETSY
jgi:hypothetical protein